METPEFRQYESLRLDDIAKTCGLTKSENQINLKLKAKQGLFRALENVFEVWLFIYLSSVLFLY